MKATMTLLSELTPSTENPRTITDDRLAELKASIQSDPLMLHARPIVALPDGTVIMGNQRLRACLELGWKKAPVARVDLDPERARYWMIRDNVTYGEWDEFGLRELLREVAAVNDPTLAGFTRDSIDALLQGQAAKPVIPEGLTRSTYDGGEVSAITTLLVAVGPFKGRAKIKEARAWLDDLRLQVGTSDTAVHEEIRRRLCIPC